MKMKVAKVDPKGGKVTVILKIIGSNISIDSSIDYHPPAPGAVIPLKDNESQSQLIANIPALPPAITGGLVQGISIIVATGSNQVWSTKMTVHQDGKCIGSDSGRGTLASPADRARAIRTLRLM